MHRKCPVEISRVKISTLEISMVESSMVEISMVEIFAADLFTVFFLSVDAHVINRQFCTQYFFHICCGFSYAVCLFRLFSALLLKACLSHSVCSNNTIVRAVPPGASVSKHTPVSIGFSCLD